MSLSIPPFTLPVRLWIDRSFSGAQSKRIQSAVNSWNQWGIRYYGQPLFEVDTTREVDSLTMKKWRQAKDYCRAGGVLWSEGVPILREMSSSHWTEDLGMTEMIPAVTYRCTYGNGQGKQSRQWILVQTELPKSLDPLEVWVLHELGHLLGLRHSCDNGPSPGPQWRSCRGLKKDSSYYRAVMYPYSPSEALPFEIDDKESLGANDRLRMGCLLESLKNVHHNK